MNFDVATSILVIALPVVVVAALGYFFTVLAGFWREFKLSKPDLANLLEQAASFAVTAAEQAGAAKLIADKKEYALTVAEEWLQLHKVEIDLHLIDAAIEKAVRERFVVDYPKTNYTYTVEK